ARPFPLALHDALPICSLQGVVAYLVVVSVGTLLAVITLGTPESYAAALYYLLHSTLICGGLFLLADLVARQRGEFAGALQQGPRSEEHTSELQSRENL